MRREALLAGASVLIGAFLGALVAAGSGGRSFVPAWWFWWVVAACLLGAILLFIVYVVIGHSDREHRKAKIAAAIETLEKGQALIDELTIWSRDHPYTAPSANADIGLVGKLGEEKTELISRALLWKSGSGELIEREEGAHAVRLLQKAAPVSPPDHVYVHPHLVPTWAEVSGYMRWLQDWSARQ